MNSASLTRRTLLAALTASLSPYAARGQNASGQTLSHGRMRPPLPLPDIALTLQDGSRSTLRQLVTGRITALQLMFTECLTSCPMQGAIFERVQQLIPDQAERSVQLLSLSINPKGEEPGALSRWVKRFHARDGWVAAVPIPSDLPRLQAFFGQGRSAQDPHTTQVQIVNREAFLVWKTPELPSPEEVAAVLQGFSRQSRG